MYSHIAFTISSDGFQLVMRRAKPSGKEGVSLKLHPRLLDAAVGSEGLRDSRISSGNPGSAGFLGLEFLKQRVGVTVAVLPVTAHPRETLVACVGIMIHLTSLMSSKTSCPFERVFH